MDMQSLPKYSCPLYFFYSAFQIALCFHWPTTENHRQKGFLSECKGKLVRAVSKAELAKIIHLQHKKNIASIQSSPVAMD